MIKIKEFYLDPSVLSGWIQKWVISMPDPQKNPPRELNNGRRLKKKKKYILFFP